MTFGVCVGIDPRRAEEALESGFSYVEMPARELLTAEGAAFAREFRPPAANLFLADGLSFRDPEEKLQAYAGRLFSAAREAGIELLVVGSGAGRRSGPGAADPASALALFIDRLAALQEMAAAFGILLAPEALRREETDVLNLSADAAALADGAAWGWTADSFHILAEGEEMDAALPRAPDHAHLGDRARYWLRSGDPEAEAFADRLRATGYSGRASLECRWMGFADELLIARRELERLFA